MGQEISQKLLEWSPSQVRDALKIPCFEDDYPDLYWDSVRFTKVVERAWDHAVQTWNTKSMSEIISYQFQNPYKFLLSNHVAYYNPLYSAKLICRLILNQCHTTDESKTFIDNLFLVLDKIEPKKNTFCMVSPPNAGKSFIISSILKLIWNEGNVENAEKGGSSFTFQEAYNKRAAKWNECVLNGKKNVEQAKEIWEGCPCAVQVKYKSGTVLDRTPLLVSANKLPWAHYPSERDAFMSRCFLYQWAAQPWLEQVALKPCPLAWKYIVENYQDLDWWNELPSTSEFADKHDDEKVLKNSFLTWIEEQEDFDPLLLEFILKQCNLYKSLK